MRFKIVSDLGRRLSGRSMDVVNKHELIRMHHTYNSSNSNLHPNIDTSQYNLNDDKKQVTKMNNTYDCDTVNSRSKDKEVLLFNANRMQNNKTSNCENIKTDNISTNPNKPTPTISLYHDQVRCDLTNPNQQSNRGTQNSSTKPSSKPKVSRRSRSPVPPPRPPRQKQQTLPLNIAMKQEIGDQPKSILHESNYSCLQNEENQYIPSVPKKSVMSPLSSCPNIYGNVTKKQPNFKENHIDEVSKSISLIASELHLLEGKQQYEVSNPRNKGSSDKTTTTCNLVPVVSPLVQDNNKKYQSDTRYLYQENNASVSEAHNPFQTSIGIETIVCTSEVRTVAKGCMGGSNHRQDVDSLTWSHNQLPYPSKCQNKIQGVNDRHYQSPTKNANHKRHRSTKTQIEHKRHNVSSPSPSSSINSGVYQKCKLCDKCSQKFQHSSKGVGTRGETTLI